jgi:phosphoribosylanthranilate isomerase
MTYVKICGLNDPGMVRHAAACGADFIGFMCVAASPRAVTPAAISNLLLHVGTARPVAVLSDPENALIDAVAATGIRVFQLHGQETPERVEDIKSRTRGEVWKAIGVESDADLEGLEAFVKVDRLVLDAKPPPDAGYAGGHGASFDWSVLQRWTSPKPWMLAGGLTPDTVADAIAATGASAVDVSSGVEKSPGLKDREKIEAFIRAAKQAEQS